METGKEKHLGQEWHALVGECLDGFLIKMAHHGARVDLQLKLVKFSHVGEEETQEGQGREPLAHCADDMCCITLQQGQTTNASFVFRVVRIPLSHPF